MSQLQETVCRTNLSHLHVQHVHVAIKAVPSYWAHRSSKGNRRMTADAN